MGDTIVFEKTLRVMTLRVMPITTTLLVLKPAYSSHFGAKPSDGCRTWLICFINLQPFLLSEAAEVGGTAHHL